MRSTEFPPVISGVMIKQCQIKNVQTLSCDIDVQVIWTCHMVDTVAYESTTWPPAAWWCSWLQRKGLWLTVWRGTGGTTTASFNIFWACYCERASVSLMLKIRTCQCFHPSRRWCRESRWCHPLSTLRRLCLGTLTMWLTTWKWYSWPTLWNLKVCLHREQHLLSLREPFSRVGFERTLELQAGMLCTAPWITSDIKGFLNLQNMAFKNLKA